MYSLLLFDATRTDVDLPHELEFSTTWPGAIWNFRINKRISESESESDMITMRTSVSIIGRGG